MRSLHSVPRGISSSEIFPCNYYMQIWLTFVMIFNVAVQPCTSFISIGILRYIFSHFVSSMAKRRISKRAFQDNKAHQIFWKTNIALFSWNTRFKIRTFALLLTICCKASIIPRVEHIFLCCEHLLITLNHFFSLANLLCLNNVLGLLTHFWSIFPFHTPWKPLVLWCFQEV